MHNLSLTLVVPCFNEEARLDAKAFVEWVCAEDDPGVVEGRW